MGDAGHLRAEGGEYTDTKIDDKGEPDEVFDGAGNKIDVQRQKALSAKDIKKKLKDGEKKKTLSDEEKWELQDKLAALKEQLGKALAGGGCNPCFWGGIMAVTTALNSSDPFLFGSGATASHALNSSDPLLFGFGARAA